MLTPYRVLDLTDRRGWLAGFLLAQLGADVVLAEPSGGWARDSVFEAYNRGKRSVTIQDPADLAGLARWADVVLDSDAWLGGDLDAWQTADPALIVVSLSAYGATGPKANWLATDLTLFAASGQMAVTADRDRPPIRTSVPQAWGHAASEVAVGALMALYERGRSGLGQHVDVSAQQAVTPDIAARRSPCRDRPATVASRVRRYPLRRHPPALGPPGEGWLRHDRRFLRFDDRPVPGSFDAMGPRGGPLRCSNRREGLDRFRRCAGFVRWLTYWWTVRFWPDSIVTDHPFNDSDRNSCPSFTRSGSPSVMSSGSA